MPKLILVKHSLPAIDPAAPAAEWRLAPEGLRRCERLAELLAPFRPAALVCSPEPKARATAAALAERWAQPYAVAEGLEEQQRRGVRFGTDAEFRQALRELFARPAELVYGEETANAAEARFAGALHAQIEHHAGRSLVAVAHGTVIALYVARRAGLDGFALWERLGLPSFIALDQESHAVEELMGEIV